VRCCSHFVHTVHALFLATSLCGRTRQCLDISRFASINEVIGNVGLHTEILHANWVEMQNIHYQPGCTLLIRMKDELPVFMTVYDIVVRDCDNVWLFGECFVNLGLASHFHTYLVSRCSPAEY
jgi:hypothetical protein